jgi:hypothetical protein
MFRVFGSVAAIAGLGLASLGGCSGDGDDAPNGGNTGSGANGTGAGSGSGGATTAGSSGWGGEAGVAPPPCPQCSSGYCLATGECVECLANPDTCAEGHCGPDNTCVPGCNGGNTCASGKCVAQSCQSCVDDSECSNGKLCGSGSCAAPCGDGTSCAGECCGARCVDTTRDVNHCGACDAACDAGEFCGASGCVRAIVANLCRTPKMAVVLNGIDVDNAAAGRMRAAIAAECSPVPALRTVSQSTTDLFNPATGQPVAGGGELLVLAGGSFGHTHVGYLEKKRIAPIYATQTDGNMLEFRQSGSDNVVMSTPYASVTPSHDFFVIQMARDPKTGTTTVMAYGFFDAGTRAAAWYFENELMPSLPTFTAPWYVFEWTDANADKAPSASEITLAGSG